ncbi:ferrous iron transport protein B [Prevotella sp. P3-120]|uniref:ferrous iron transport protein B n=1 Tax=unclassified Prevotella TaxID=2638335 RepID=UPI000B96BD0B|nr:MULTISPECIES: ferrous iron transport protein B [unclassified Prevotella]OYP48482.1 ferrous iron transport protein B [Prevotella sp. P3-120]OYP51938.1 ferrous iron transport protein B [Prevotella sp. P3-92]
MKLSDLKTGQHATIVTVQGHGSFRKRIVEMGFVRGKDVEVLLNAPLQDPVKYKVMGYEISLRRQEAEMIVVDTDPSHQQPVVNHGTMTDTVQDTCDQSLPAHVGNTINVALIGNPNCGKTSLFNFASGAHGHVGNYSGVTVDASEARATCDGFVFNLTDLPGTYSLSCYSPEELYVREHLMKRHPDVVINVIDSSNLERNLYLTTQLVDMNVRMVCALNMYDEFERRGDTLDTQTLSTLFGVPFVCTSFKSGRGVQELFREVISVFEDCNASVRHIHINHGHEIESGIAHIQQYLKRNEVVRTLFSTRYMAIKLLEHDDRAEAYVAKMENAKEIMAARDAAELRVKEEKKTDSETAIMDAKYGFIHGALTEAGFRQGTKEDTYRMTHFIDDVLSNKYLGFPIFFLILYVMFQTTFSLGQYPMDWIESAVSWLGEQASALMPEGPLRSMLVDGVIGGVGAVIVFLPQILILYFFISLMEDSGYMARAAFIMDKLMHKMGLHGKSFIPLIMGFGCNVPAIMATRTIESRRSRLITMLILPFMSCSARLPIYIMITGTFFAAQYRSWVMIMLYVIGVIVAIIVSKVFSSFVVKGEDTPFVMELPPYRWPTPKAIGRHTWEKGKEYLKKMGGIILVASIVVWALGYFPHDESLSPVQQKEQSYIGSIGKAVEPVFELQGFNWKLDVSLIAGVGAKEIVASTIGVIYSGDDSFGDDDSFSDDTAKYSRLRNQMLADGITPLAAFSYLLFVLLYFPCIATVIAIRNETGSWSWAAFSAFYTTAIAWIVSMLVYQIGSLF